MKRRRLLATASAAPCLLPLGSWAQGLAAPAGAPPQSVQQAVLAAWADGRPVTGGGLRLELAELVDNGNDVPIRLLLEWPSGSSQRLQALALWAWGNPQPLVLQAQWPQGAVRAELATRIRLATSQRLTALARLSDGTVRRGDAQVVVTLAACVEA